MKKWFDKMDKNKKRIMGAGIVALVLLLTLGAWGVYTVTAKPQDAVAKGDAIDGKGSGKEKADEKRDEEEALTREDEDESTVEEDEDKKDAEENMPESDTKATESTKVAGSSDATAQGAGNNSTSASSNPTKNTAPQGNSNSNQTVAPTQPQTQATTSKQNGQQQNQSQSQTPSTPVQNTTPAATEPKQETKPTEQTKQEQKQPVWHDPVYERRWVVDQAAWDETVSTPIYEYREVAICNTCGANISGHATEHIMDGDCESYRSDVQSVQTGTNTQTIHHDEVGHWEEVMVKEGYWE